MDCNKRNSIKNDRSLFRKPNCTEFKKSLKNASWLHKLLKSRNGTKISDEK